MQLRPSYLVRGRSIDRAGVTERLRPWSTKTARSCRVVTPTLGKERARTVARVSSRETGRARIRKDGPRPRRCHIWSMHARRLTRECTFPRSA
jgi:hypothetical protein